jgi:hypothetical protein
MPYFAAPVLLQVSGSFQTSSVLLESGYVLRPDSSSMLGSPVTSPAMPSWTNNNVQKPNISHGTTGLASYIFGFH